MRSMVDGLLHWAQRAWGAPFTTASRRSPSAFRGRVFFALLAFLSAAPALAQTFPAFTGFVVDAANVIPPAEEARLTAKLARLQRDTRHQLAVASVPSLEGDSIADFANRLARRWEIGRRHFDDGVLLLIAPREHKVRIEVGYGLEATLTDPRCAAIIRDLILPRFKRKDLPGGIETGVDAIIARLRAAVPLEEPRAA